MLDKKAISLKIVIERLRSMSNKDAVTGMARYGINPANNYGVSVTKLRQIAKEIGVDHKLALQLWACGIHDARILASIIDDPAAVTEEQMDSWARDFDSWDVCDETCNNLFSKTPFAYDKAEEWCGREEEFVRRAGFVLMADLALHDGKANNKRFVTFLNLIESGTQDEKKYVKKAINWALRQIGKRNLELNRTAIDTAKRILNLQSKGSRRIASNALKELTNDKIRRKLQTKGRDATLGN